MSIVMYPLSLPACEDLPGVFEYKDKEKRMLRIESEDHHEEETMKTKATSAVTKLTRNMIEAQELKPIGLRTLEKNFVHRE